MEIDPKTIVWYPFFTFVTYVLLSLVFEWPIWSLFIALGIVFLYYIVIIIIELNK